MYILLAGTVLSGLLIGILFWSGIKTGLLIDCVIYLHELIINILYFFIGIHVFAAVYHRLKSDGVWSSMVPIYKEKSKKLFERILIKFIVNLHSNYETNV